jgi:hypothetical protein
MNKIKYDNLRKQQSFQIQITKRNVSYFVHTFLWCKEQMRYGGLCVWGVCMFTFPCPVYEKQKEANNAISVLYPNVKFGTFQPSYDASFGRNGVGRMDYWLLCIYVYLFTEREWSGYKNRRLRKRKAKIIGTEYKYLERKYRGNEDETYSV